jgi:transposase-like protein
MTKRRKKYSKQFKTQALEAANEPDVTVADVARQLDIDSSLLYSWRAQQKNAC